MTTLTWRRLTICFIAAACFAGCAEDTVDFNPADKRDGGQDGDGTPPNRDTGPDDEADIRLPDPIPAVPSADCNAYDFRGQTFNCGELDRCNELDFSYRLACCECDPIYCDPDPTCFEDPGEPGPDPDPNNPDPQPEQVETCMQCHNGAQRNDYSGNGMSNPHPFPGAQNIRCTQCHGGNPRGAGKLGSHVPPPPSIGDKQNQIVDEKAWFNRRTLAGIDKLEPAQYEAPGRPGESFTNLDYLQFVNPGDLRVVTDGRGCGADGCHFNKHAQWVPRTSIATSTGILSTPRFNVGVENRIPDYRGRNRDGDSLADSAPRAVTNPAYSPQTRDVGEVGRLVEQPERAGFFGPMRDNGVYDANTLANHIINNDQDPARPNRVRADSPLEVLIDEQINITCGDCHLYSAGQNDRYADFRSSGCTACHMEYSYDGRSRTTDPNVNKQEPANPDEIVAPERSHIETHQIRNVAKVLPNGAFVRGISDRACVGCHQGSNRTVLQFWGIRLDQNQDVVGEFQYPTNPVTFTDTAADARLYNPGVGNNTFNGRIAQQHILTEDYDGDGRDDTPPDIHYEKGMGCIDCHGSRDLHGGVDGDPKSGKIQSRMDQTVQVRCESCHGVVDSYAPTAPCTTYAGQEAECAVDASGNPLRNVTKDAQGHYWLMSRLSGQRHYVYQTRDLTVNTNRVHPLTSQLLYSQKASYFKGRPDGNPQTGIGPQQNNPNLVSPNFSHLDNMDCSSCHSAWVNSCIGCHLSTEYNVDPNEYLFSNITGERILLAQANADFVYQSVVPMYLGVNSRGRISQLAPGTKTFWRYNDLNDQESAVYAFSDRLGEGNNPNNGGRNAFPSLAMNQFASHSTRGKVTATAEGPRYCVACHLTQQAMDNYGDDYVQFWNDYQNNNLANLDFALLQEHIGANPGNQLDSPFFVHMVAGLGTGLFLFDADGCPINPFDNRDDRFNCNNGAPADNFADAINNVAYDLDRIVEFNGVPNSSSAHPRTELRGAQRVGSSNPEMAGPLDAQRIQKLADPNAGLILDSWLNADGAPYGGAVNYIQQ